MSYLLEAGCFDTKEIGLLHLNSTGAECEYEKHSFPLLQTIPNGQ